MFLPVLVLALSAFQTVSLPGPGPVQVASASPVPGDALNTRTGVLSYHNTLTAVSVPLPKPTISGNTVVVWCNEGDSQGSISSITDEQSDSYISAASVDDSGNGAKLEVWYAHAVAAGARNLVVHYSAGTQYIGCSAKEFYNVGVVDKTCTATGSGTTITCSSMTPTVTGDLIIQAAIQDSGPTITHFTVGSHANITLSMGSSNSEAAMALQWGVYNSTSAYSVAMGQSPTNSWATVGVAFKPASSGSAPSSGIQVVQIMDISNDQSTAGSPAVDGQALDFTCDAGNLIALGFIGAAATGGHPSSISSSPSNTWTLGATQTQTSGSYDQWWYAANASVSNSMTVTETMSATSYQATTVFYCIAGAATSPFDTTQGQSGTNTTTPAPNLTPTAITVAGANELVLSEIGVYYNTASGLSGSNYLFDSVILTGASENDSGDGDENNGWGRFLSTGAGSIGFTWTPIDTAQYWNLWDALSIAFKSP